MVTRLAPWFSMERRGSAPNPECHHLTLITSTSISKSQALAFSDLRKQWDDECSGAIYTSGHEGLLVHEPESIC